MNSQIKESNMKHHLKVLMSAMAVAATAATMLSASVSAQTTPPPGQGYVRHGSVYGPLYNPHNYSNGTGSVSDADRDPHNDR
jgi:ABC-type oligopeptide transport system substrate-binding subunit